LLVSFFVEIIFVSKTIISGFMPLGETSFLNLPETLSLHHSRTILRKLEKLALSYAFQLFLTSHINRNDWGRSVVYRVGGAYVELVLEKAL